MKKLHILETNCLFKHRHHTLSEKTKKHLANTHKYWIFVYESKVNVNIFSLVNKYVEYCREIEKVNIDYEELPEFPHFLDILAIKFSEKLEDVNVEIPSCYKGYTYILLGVY